MSTEILTPDCPKCGKADSIDLDNGERLCLNCRNEWDPHRAHALPAAAFAPQAATLADKYDIAAILSASTAEEVLGVPPLPPPAIDVPDPTLAPVGAAFEDWTEQFARTPGGDVICITEDLGTGMVAGVDRWGDKYEAAKAACIYIGDDPVEAMDASEVLGEVTSEPVIPAVLAVAGLAITVGLEAISEDESVGLTHARIGWLPPPANEVPEAEQGVAYAIALIVRIFGLDRAEVAKLAANLLVGSEAGIDPEGEGQEA